MAKHNPRIPAGSRSPFESSYHGGYQKGSRTQFYQEQIAKRQKTAGRLEQSLDPKKIYQELGRLTQTLVQLEGYSNPEQLRNAVKEINQQNQYLKIGKAYLPTGEEQPSQEPSEKILYLPQSTRFSPLSRNRRKSAFTLTELLCSIGIMGTLAAITFPAFAPANAGAKTLECRNNLRQWASPLQPFESQEHSMPATNNGSHNCPWNGAGYLHYGRMIEEEIMSSKDAKIGQCLTDPTTWPLDKVGQIGSGIVRFSYFQRGIPQGAPQDTTEKKIIMLCDNHKDFWIVVSPAGETALIPKTFAFDRTNTSHWDYMDQKYKGK